MESVNDHVEDRELVGGEAADQDLKETQVHYVQHLSRVGLPRQVMQNPQSFFLNLQYLEFSFIILFGNSFKQYCSVIFRVF